MKKDTRAWAHIKKKCLLVHALVTKGKLTPTRACQKAKVHYGTYKNWLMTRDNNGLIDAVLVSDMKPKIKLELINRLGGKYSVEI